MARAFLDKEEPGPHNQMEVVLEDVHKPFEKSCEKDAIETGRQEKEEESVFYAVYPIEKDNDTDDG